MPMMPFIGVRISWLVFARELRLRLGALEGTSRAAESSMLAHGSAPPPHASAP